MKKNNKIIGLGLLLLMVVVGYLFFEVFNESGIDIRKAETDVTISAQNLVSSFLDNESLANSTYVEKTLEVSGIVKEVNYLNDRYTIFLDGGETFACLMCDMNTDQIEKIEQIVPGQTIRIKGICKGFLLDAILLNCVVLQ